MCEESASTVISSTQVALAIEDVTHVSLSKKIVFPNNFRLFKFLNTYYRDKNPNIGIS